MIYEGGVLTGDSPLYLKKFAILRQSLLAGDWHFLFTHDEQVHTKLYTVSYTILYPLFGDSILSFELINVPLFVLAVYLIYQIGKSCFDETAGWTAGILLFLFPTMLAHFSQPLRDPVAICLFLLLCLILTKALKEILDLRKAVLSLLAASATFFVLYMTRENMLVIFLGFIAITVGICFLWNWRGWREKKYNFLMLAGLLAFCLACPVFLSRFLPNPYIFLPANDEEIETLRQGTAKVYEYEKYLKESEVPGYLEKLNVTRHKFLLFYRGAGTNIDDEVVFRSFGDLVLYVPRAIEIGLFAPFPNMWFAEGRDVGRAGRMISGAETFISYLLVFCALFTLFRFRRNIFAWQIFLTIIFAAFVLGIGVVNVGALYRLRYVFWCLLIVLAAKGICLLTEVAKRKPLNAENK